MATMRLRVIVPTVCAALALAAPASSNAAVLHLVAPGESLSSIAAADGLSVSSLAAANGLAPDAFLTAGSTVVIPPQGVALSAPASSTSTSAGDGDEPDCDSDDPGDGDADGDDCAGSSAETSTSTATATPVATTSSAGAGTYTVMPGDTLTGVAARMGTTVSALAAANGLSLNSFLIAGSVIHTSGVASASAPVSTTVPVSTTTTTLPQTSTQPVGAAAQGSPTAPPYPTPETMSAGQIGSIASTQGVSSSLADAIAWQESGFNNDLVSSADARGIMQITPGTWAWIQHSLDTGAPLAPASASDNVRGGSIMLNWLLNQTGGDPAMAAAGYYQGLSSVRANGMYTDTQAYVQSVMALRHRFGG
jgi:LysM repeat protein